MTATERLEGQKGKQKRLAFLSKLSSLGSGRPLAGITGTSELNRYHGTGMRPDQSSADQDFLSGSNRNSVNGHLHSIDASEDRAWHGLMSSPYQGTSDIFEIPRYHVTVRSVFDQSADSRTSTPLSAVNETSIDKSQQSSLNGHMEPVSSTLSQERFKKYGEYKQRLYFLLDAVIPRFIQLTDTNRKGSSQAEKWDYFSGLVDAYSIVESSPDLESRREAVLQSSRVNDEHLAHVEAVMGAIEDDKIGIFSEVEDIDKRELNSRIRKAKRRVGRSFINNGITLEIEKQDPPSPLVAELAQMNAVIQIFRGNGFDHIADHRQK